MADSYWRYGAPAERAASIPTSSFPGYLPSVAPPLSTHHMRPSVDLHGSSSEYLPKDISSYRAGAYSVDDMVGGGVRPDPAFAGYATGTSMKGYSNPIEDASLLGPRRDVALGVTPSVPDILNERPSSFGMTDGLPAVNKESNVLFVDGLPNDCSRREVGHLFRPFIGFREIRVVHKEPRRTGDKAKVLCFVEFTDAKCALTALEALQGYKFDNKKPDSPVLRIIFAHFPFRPPSDYGELPYGVAQ